MADTRPLIAVEDDPFTRIIAIVLDPDTAPERVAAFARFFAHDLPDFGGWCDGLRRRLTTIHPARVQLVMSASDLSRALASAQVAVIESLPVTARELAGAPALRVVQKFGTVCSNIDRNACAARGIRVLTLRRRANMACAEHALGLMLALARKICDTNGLVSVERLRAAGYAPAVLDRRHTANSNWACITGLRTLHGATLGIVGMGEIGREIALRAAPFGMKIVYTQRHRLDAAEETHYGARYGALEHLLAASDYVSLNLPGNAATRGIIGRRELTRMKRGAILINVARADLVDRAALLNALDSGHLGGFGSDLPYEEPGRDEDPLLRLRQAIVTPHIAAQPRFNALDDLEELLLTLNEACR